MDNDTRPPENRVKRPAHIQGLLDYGAPVGQRTGAINSITLSDINRRIPREITIRDILASPLGDRAREGSRDGLFEMQWRVTPGWLWLEDRYSECEEWIEANPAIYSATSADTWERWMNSVTWKPATRRKVAEALLEINREQGEGVFRASVREVAEKAGCHKDTASKHLDAMVDEIGCLAEVTDGPPRRASDARRWRLRCPSRSANIRTLPPHTIGKGEPDTSHDAFRHLALGAAKLTLNVLDEDTDTTVTEIAAAIGRKRRTVYNHLAKLTFHGLVQRTERGYRRIPLTEAKLDEIATACGTQGAGETQRNLHELQREGYRRWLRMRDHLRRQRQDAERGLITVSGRIISLETGQVLAHDSSVAPAPESCISDLEHLALPSPDAPTYSPILELEEAAIPC